MGQAKLRKSEIAALKANGNRVKELGQVFTPFSLVKEMLDKLSAMAIPDMFNPAEVSMLNSMFKLAA